MRCMYRIGGQGKCYPRWIGRYALRGFFFFLEKENSEAAVRLSVTEQESYR